MALQGELSISSRLTNPVLAKPTTQRLPGPWSAPCRLTPGRVWSMPGTATTVSRSTQKTAMLQLSSLSTLDTVIEPLLRASSQPGMGTVREWTRSSVTSLTIIKSALMTLSSGTRTLPQTSPEFVSFSLNVPARE